MRRFLLISARDHKLARELDAIPRTSIMHQIEVTHPSRFLNGNVISCVASTSGIATAAPATTDFDGGEDESSHDRTYDEDLSHPDSNWSRIHQEITAEQARLGAAIQSITDRLPAVAFAAPVHYQSTRNRPSRHAS